MTLRSLCAPIITIHWHSCLSNRFFLLCCPLLVPQMVEGLLPPDPVTEKKSVKHLERDVALTPPAVTVLPDRINESDKVTVFVPEMTNELKSIRS